MNLADLRQSYTKGGLTEAEASEDPFVQFALWFEQARNSGNPEPNAMTLATASASGVPSARIVLLKGVSEGGFVFYTNYQSRKGYELDVNPHAALLFYWPELERQVRILGRVKRLSRAESEEYFASRPRGHQLGAWVSKQSSEIPHRQSLDLSLAAMEQKYNGRAVPMPPFWGGFRLKPGEFEFWQGRPNRLHDRLEYVRVSGSWQRRRLAP